MVETAAAENCPENLKSDESLGLDSYNLNLREYLSDFKFQIFLVSFYCIIDHFDKFSCFFPAFEVFETGDFHLFG
jgi:hypothetical protein